ncbi:MAG: transposase [Nitrospirae bacterium]|nr:transposase [Nitrospirota bacterium]
MTDRLTQARLRKLDRLRKEGLDPYPARSNRSHTSRAAIEAFEAAAKDEEVRVVVAGRLRSIREMGKTAFAHIEDTDGRLQLYLRQDQLGPDQLDLFLEAFDLGDFIQAEGELFRTRTGEVTVRVASFLMLSKATYPLPAAKEELVDDEIVVHSAFDNPEARYRERYADLAVNPEVREVFQTRARIIDALRQYLNNLGFLEVETPVLQSIYGGAAAEPFVTHHKQLHRDLYLRISFELYLKRLLVGGLERVYEIGKDFRNEGVDRTHQPEFTQLEFYMAYADYQLVMDVTEDMIAYVVEQVLGGAQFEYQGRTIDVTPPWGRIELQAAIAEQTGIDFSKHKSEKALRKAIAQVFGADHPVQRCRNHKLRNILGHLPKDQHPQATAAIRAAWKLDAKDGMQKLEQRARWLGRDHPSAAASLREGLREMFTINRLGLPPRLRKCLGTTNVIDSTHSGVRQKTRRVTNWKNGAMALRWAAASFVETEKNYRRIIGYDQLWILKAHLDDHQPVAEMRMVG